MTHVPLDALHPALSIILDVQYNPGLIPSRFWIAILHTAQLRADGVLVWPWTITHVLKFPHNFEKNVRTVSRQHIAIAAYV